MNTFDILSTYGVGLAHGLLVTVQLCALIWTSGILGGTLLGALSVRFRTLVGAPSRTFGFTLSGVPILVLLIWVHYPLQSLLQVVINPFATTAVVLSCVNIFVVSDVIRRALLDFPLDYVEAATVCGLSKRQILLKIQLPIVARQVVPNLLRAQVNMLHATIFGSVISVTEIFRVTQQINSVIYRPVEVYTALALLFLIVSLPINALALSLSNRLTRQMSGQ